MFGNPSPKCPVCKMIVTKLVPYADCDHAHQGKMTCVKCKRKLKKPKVMETGEDDVKNVQLA